jgi:hypothetical protein
VGPPREVIEAYTDTVHIDRRVDDEGHSRWGSGEGRIVGVELLGDGGRPVDRIHTGEAVVVRLHYQMEQPIERPVFGISILTMDGFEVATLTNRDVDCVPETLSGAGQVDITFEDMRLLPGTYDLTVSLTDYTALHAHDVRTNVLRWDVERGRDRQTGGVVALRAGWKLGDPGLHSVGQVSPQAIEH